MPKKKKLQSGTIWFCVLVLIAIIGALLQLEENSFAILVLVLGICGAIIAMINIRIAEEKTFLQGVSALAIIILAWIYLLPPELMVAQLKNFLEYLLVGFGVAGFIIALAEIARCGITK